MKSAMQKDNMNTVNPVTLCGNHTGLKMKNNEVNCNKPKTACSRYTKQIYCKSLFIGLGFNLVGLASGLLPLK